MGKKIYIAGPLFSLHEKQFLELIVNFLSKRIKGLDSERDFFLPHRDAGDLGIIDEKEEPSKKKDMFSKDLKFLDEVEIVIAVLDGVDVDSGTAVELGYAYSKKKKIFGVLSDHRAFKNSKIKDLNNMVWGVCEDGKSLILLNELKDLELLSNLLEKYLGRDISGG